MAVASRTTQSLLRLRGEDDATPAKEWRAVDSAGGCTALHLARPGPPGDLPRGLGEVAHPVEAPLAEAPAEGVQRQLAAPAIDLPALDESVGFAAPAESSRFEPVVDRR